MTVAEADATAVGGASSREQRERQLLEAMQRNPMEIYAAYLSAFGVGGADAPTLTPLAMVRCLVDREFPQRAE